MSVETLKNQARYDPSGLRADFLMLNEKLWAACFWVLRDTKSEAFLLFIFQKKHIQDQNPILLPTVPL